MRNEFRTNLIPQYDYEYDALGRRKSVVNSGQAFAADALNRYGYDDRNQLTDSSRYLGSDVNDLSSPVNPEHRAYQYDSIGSRQHATGWDDEVSAAKVETYTSNSLNQYGQISADNGQPTTDNLTYDQDGNLTGIANSDSNKQFKYSAENRLITVEPEVPVDGDSKVEFSYDYMGRRVEKRVYTWNAGQWALGTTKWFFYNSWNVIIESTDNGQTTTNKYYVWGIDLSQSLQGAGGIGGLIAAIDSSLTDYFCYDGNGNVGQLVNASDGSISAHYEYDPFGNIIIANAPAANNNPYRFSTKYFDNETEFYYYGYRYYSPELGRWLNRDPLGELGGTNLYLFVSNGSINKWDLLGRSVHPLGVASPDKIIVVIERLEEDLKKYYDWHLDITKTGNKENIDRIHTLKVLKRLGGEIFDTAYIKGEKNKWVFTCKYGWIDIGHFFNTSYASTFLKDPQLAYDLSLKFETMGQRPLLWIPIVKNWSDAQSAGTPEDLNSNYQGAYFRHGNIGNITTNFDNFLKGAGAVKFYDGDNTHLLLMDNVSSVLGGKDLEIYEGERYYTKEEQLNYQRFEFRAFCELCDGDKPKQGLAY